LVFKLLPDKAAQSSWTMEIEIEVLCLGFCCPFKAVPRVEVKETRPFKVSNLLLVTAMLPQQKSK